MANNAYLRAFVCLIFGTLVFVQVANSGTKPNFNDPAVQADLDLRWKQTLGNLEWLLAGGSQAGYESRHPVAPLTNPTPSSKPIGYWELYLDPSGKPSTKTKADFQFLPSKPDVADVSAKFKMRDVAGALGRFANKVLTPLALGSALFDLAREIGFWVSRNPDGSVKYEKDGSPSCTLTTSLFGTGTGSSCQIAANDLISKMTPQTINDWHITGFTCTNVFPDTTVCNISYHTSPPSYASYYRATPTYGQSSNLPKVPATQQEFEDAIADKPTYSPTSKIIDAIRDAMKDKEKIRPDPTTITTTGPATGQSPQPVVKDTPESTTTTTTTNNYTYNGSKITNSSTTTINNYSKVSNTTTTTTITNDTQPEPPKDFCEDAPMRVGCLDVDTPELEMPKKTENVTYMAESLFGGGSCPSPKTFTYFGFQHEISYQGTCDALSNYVRYIIIASALFSAYLMILASIRR